jgi:hypothetical protein
VKDSLAPSRVLQYRHRAEEARTKAESMTNGPAREAMLRDAEMWERMAAFEEKNKPT